MVYHTVRRIPLPSGTYPYRRSLEHFLRKRAMVLHKHVAAVNVVYSEHRSSETVKYFWNEMSPHLVYRNPEKQIFKSTIRNGPTGIKICFEDGKLVFLDGDVDYVEPKPMSQLVEEFMKIAGCNEVEYEERTKPSKRFSWSTPHAECICDIQGQCPCPKKVSLPMAIYYKRIEHGPRDSFGQVVDLEEFPEGTSQIFSPAEQDHYMTYNKPKKY